MFLILPKDCIKTLLMQHYGLVVSRITDHLTYTLYVTYHTPKGAT